MLECAALQRSLLERALPGEPARAAGPALPLAHPQKLWEKLCASPALESLVSWPSPCGSHQLAPFCAARHRGLSADCQRSARAKDLCATRPDYKKQYLRKSSQKTHFKDKVKHPDYCSVFCYQHVPPPSTIRVNIYRAAFSTSQLQFTDTNLHT